MESKREELRPRSLLSFNDYIFDVRLGVTAEEREIPQPVSFSVQIRYDNIPKSCLTDNVEDTDNYECFATAVQKVVALKEYRLIEHLAHALYVELGEHPGITVKIKKIRVPIVGLAGGTEFTIGEI